ncbi:hypothetical protein BO86DRAFT_64404 [Aspergillus japonicus CBS 114.51]|uniref:Uncharacterized protein n=1 Tax=Aspergillus japonicus CBS 114.51 TaxID=1448312 RepID=A0A8T8X670_ASPJA|nr:hypothetical protein BO86DRAFT_64404 [Aspergillus japonicus CBS 114.51]RAH82939.1 hypothetical protein BO86DRAFT_64404 [Aspergillus japonicus CBS 114.51]
MEQAQDDRGSGDFEELTSESLSVDPQFQSVRPRPSFFLPSCLSFSHTLSLSLAVSQSCSLAASLSHSSFWTCNSLSSSPI